MRIRNWGFCALLLAIVSVGCQSGDSETGTGGENGGQVGSDLEGKVQIDGSSTVYPISEQIAEEFKEKYPKVEVIVGFSGTGGGFEKFVAGTTDISDASRPIKTSENEAAAGAMIDYIELPVAYDGLSIVVNPENTWVDQLTIDQLKTIFLADSAAKTWADVDPSWPAEEIKLFIPGTDSGTFDYFAEVVAGKTGSIRNEGVSTDENDNSLVASVAGDRNAMGFFGAAYYFAHQDELRAVPIVNPAGDAVAPTPWTIEDGTYAPFGRPLFIYVSVNSLDRLEVQKFVDFYMANVGRVANEVGYVRLPEAVYEVDRTNLDQRTTGSRYINEAGEAVSGTLLEVYGIPAAE